MYFCSPNDKVLLDGLGSPAASDNLGVDSPAASVSTDEIENIDPRDMFEPRRKRAQRVSSFSQHSKRSIQTGTHFNLAYHTRRVLWRWLYIVVRSSLNRKVIGFHKNGI